MTHEQANELLQSITIDAINEFVTRSGKPLCFFDLETTTAKPETARIVSISVVKINLDGSRELKHKIVNPGVTMSDEVIEIHGITNEIAQNEPPFYKYAKAFAAFIDGCMLAGYNSNHFDKPILAKELKLAGIDPVELLGNVEFIDVYNIYCHFNRRRLIDAVKNYLVETMSDAHSSAYDSIKTMQVLNRMIIKHKGELPEEPKLLSEFNMTYRPVDFEGKIALNKKGEVVFTFGKHKDKKVESVIGRGGIDVNYYDWMLNSGFSKDTLEVMNRFRQPSL